MPYVAYRDKEHKQKVLAKDVLPREQESIFYCQNKNCNCKYIVSALNSNAISVHFMKLKSSSHIDGCWNAREYSISGNKNDYNTSDFSPENLLGKVLIDGEEKQVGGTHKRKKKGKSFATEQQYIHTIRQLYSVCMQNDDEDEINGTIIKDIFAGRKTSYLYTKYISGIKLVECSYFRYSRNERTIYFKFPYDNKTMNLTVQFNTIKLFNDKLKEIYNYKGIILIYAKWERNIANISSKNQIVLIK